MKLKISDKKLQTVLKAVDSAVKKLAENPNMTLGVGAAVGNVAIAGAGRKLRRRQRRNALFTVYYEVCFFFRFT